MDTNPYTVPLSNGDLLYNKIRADALQLLRSGIRLTVWWDAGGDSTPGTVEAIGQPLDPHLERALYWTIVRVLDLPNAGFVYDKGKGELFAEADGSLSICFTSREIGYSVEEKRQPEERRVIPFDDPCNLLACMERVNVFLEGSVSYTEEVRSHFNLSVREGDLPAVSAEEREHYEAQAKKLAMEYAGQVRPEKVMLGDEEVLVGGEVSARLVGGKNGQAEFRITFHFTQLFDHVDERVELISAGNEQGKWLGRKVENYC